MQKLHSYKQIRELRKAVKEGSLDRGAFQFLMGVTAVEITDEEGKPSGKRLIGFASDENDE